MIEFGSLVDDLGRILRLVVISAAFLYWLYSLKITRHFWEPFLVLLFLFCIGVFLPPIFQQILLLSLVVGFGWSLRQLLMDIFAGLLLVLEKRLPIGGWVHGEHFSGEILGRNWRGILIRDVDGRDCLLPNRLFLSSSFRISPPGQYGITLRFWVPEGLSLHQAEERLRSWLPCSPWLADGNFTLYPDPSNPRILIIRMRLLHADHEDNVIRSLRRQLEKSPENFARIEKIS